MQVIPGTARDPLLFSPPRPSPNLFQFTDLRGENFFAEASQKIAELGEAQRAKRKSTDYLDFPLAAQDVNGRLNRTAVVNLHRGLRAYKFVRTSPRYKAVIPCGGNIRPAQVSLNSADGREPHKMGARK